MRKLLLYPFFLIFACIIGKPALADDISARPTAAKGVLVVEFGEASPAGSKLGDAIAQAKREYEQLESLTLPDEQALAPMLEKRADGNLGLVILVHPADRDTLSKLPGLYPDILFTVIDMPEPLYAANVQFVQFKEEEGAFLLGAIAAIRTDNRIAVLAQDDDKRSRDMAEHFRAGAHHIRPAANVDVLSDLKPSASQHTRLAAHIEQIFQNNTDIVFSMDNDIVEPALRIARTERKMVIGGDVPPAGADTSRLMTYMVKRYDLALVDVMHIYTHKQWHAGTIGLGVAGGYVDYSLNADNVELFPKDSIDRIEAIKDYIGQGMLLKAE